jgi:uncharacterized repeat protein (TIGR03803 family)
MDSAIQNKLSSGNKGRSHSCVTEPLERRLVMSAATQLVIAQCPVGAAAENYLSPVVVDVDDVNKNIVTTDSSPVTLTISTGTFYTGSPSVVANAVDGVATFSSLGVSFDGTFKLTASDGTLTPATSPLIQNNYAVNIFSILGGKADSGVTRDSAGDLFGTTTSGEIFEIPVGSTTAKSLASAGVSGHPNAVAVDSSGDVFGTTQVGGANEGSIFEVVANSGSATQLASFNTSNGSMPMGGVTLDSADDLFGTTSDGGGSGIFGTVWELPHNSNTIQDLVVFNNAGNGGIPYGTLATDSSGNLYGTTSQGGTNGYGTLFEITAAHSFKTLANLNSSTGAPAGGVAVDSSGDVFGLSSGGASNDGMVFEWIHSSSTLRTVASFSGLQDEEFDENAGVAVDSAGDVFGTTGATDGGTAFEVANGGSTVSEIAYFSSIADTGSPQPIAPMTLAPNGDLYGTIDTAKNGGTVFKLTFASKMAFTQSPGNATAGVAVNGNTGVKVEIQDSTDLSVTDNSTVTLTLSSGSFNGGGNTLTALSDNGYAMFSPLVIDTPGTYTLTASDGTLPVVVSNTFQIEQNLPVVTTNPVSQTIASGATVSFTASATGTPMPTVQWQVSTNAGLSFANVSNATSTTYSFSASESQSQNQYRAVFTNASGSVASSAATLNVLPAWLSPTSTATWNPSTQVLNVTGPASVVSDPGSDEPIILANGSSAVITLDPTSGTDVHLGGLSLTGGASATLTSLGAARSPTNYHLLVIGTTGSAAAPTYTIDSTSTLDLADNDMAVLYGNGPSPLATVASGISQAYNNGLWNRPGLTSSVARLSPGINALGFGEAATLGYGSFDGLALDNHAVLVKYTYYGDANLSGKVDGSDYTLIDNAFQNHLTGWYNGDFNYDGVVNGSDYTLIDNAFNRQGASLAVAAPSVMVAKVKLSARNTAVFASAALVAGNPSAPGGVAQSTAAMLFSTAMADPASVLLDRTQWDSPRITTEDLADLDTCLS